MTEEERYTIVVLEQIMVGMLPDYCIHGQVRCRSCNAWCWLGDQTFEAVASGLALPVCQPCAAIVTMIDGETKPAVTRLYDHQRDHGVI